MTIYHDEKPASNGDTHRIKAVITDWCGTIEGNVKSRLDSILSTCEALNLPSPTQSMLQDISGMSLSESVSRILPSNDTALRKKFIAHQSNLQKSQNNQLIASTETLAWLKKHTRFCLFTNGSTPFIANNIKQYQLQSIFEIIATSDDYPDKPAPDMLIDISNQLKIPPSSCLVVGDHLFDLVAANSAKMPCVIVQSGALDKKNFSTISPQPLQFCQDINDIPKLIQSINHK